MDLNGISFHSKVEGGETICQSAYDGKKILTLTGYGTHGEKQNVIASYAQPFLAPQAIFQDAGCILHEHEPGFQSGLHFTGTHKEPGPQLVLQGM